MQLSLCRHAITALVPWRPLARHCIHAGLLGLRLLCRDTEKNETKPLSAYVLKRRLRTCRCNLKRRIPGGHMLRSGLPFMLQQLQHASMHQVCGIVYRRSKLPCAHLQGGGVPAQAWCPPARLTCQRSQCRPCLALAWHGGPCTVPSNV